MLISLFIILLITSPISSSSVFDGITLKKSLKELKNHNPCISQKFSADPGVMVYNNRVYVYSTNDGYLQDNIPEQNTYSQITTINIMSSDDLVNWSDHGTVTVAGSNGVAKWAGNSWAPSAAHKKINNKEKFFLYFANNANGIGVLTSDSPTGPWSDPLGKPLISRSNSNCNDVIWLFDPAVLVDDDGTGYLYFGGGVPSDNKSNPGTIRAVKLGNDMISLNGNIVKIDAPWVFEDSGIHKKNGIYYYSYCLNWSGGPYGSARIAYMTSNNPLGPFTMKNACFENPGVSFGTYGNNHHTIIEFKNKLYIFYHAEWFNKLAYGSQLGYRTTHVDEMPQNGNELGLTKGTETGVTQVQNFNPYTVNRFNTMAWQAGINIYGLGDTFAAFNKGDWIGISKVNFGNGAKTITVKGGSVNGAVIKICIGNPSNNAVAYLSIPATGNNWNFTEVKINIYGLYGVQDLFFVASDDVLLSTYQFS